MSTAERVRRLLVRVLSLVERGLDRTWYRVTDRFGWNEPQSIAVYRGFANAEHLWVEGRVLADAPMSRLEDDASWWDNLSQAVRRWHTNELPGVEVELRFRDQVQRVVSGREAYYQARFDWEGPLPPETLWLSVETIAHGERRSARGCHEVLVPGRRARFVVVSDMDDTVIHTGISSLITSAKLTFFGNAKTRKPLQGVAALYRALVDEERVPGSNPIFYVSSSAWNLHDLFRDFLENNDIPPGPILLQDVGLGNNRFVGYGHQHKLEKVERILAAYPDLDVVLIGDSSQADAELYVEAARRHPGRIAAIYIRKVGPDSREESALVRKAMQDAGELGIELILGRTSLDFAEHAAGLGLVSVEAVDDVAASVDRDQHRPAHGMA